MLLVLNLQLDGDWILSKFCLPSNNIGFTVINFLLILYFQETTNHVYLVMEYCNGGDLADYLQGNDLDFDLSLFHISYKQELAAVLFTKIVSLQDRPVPLLYGKETKNKQVVIPVFVIFSKIECRANLKLFSLAKVVCKQKRINKKYKWGCLLVYMTLQQI